MLSNRSCCRRAAFGFADTAEQALFQHHVHKLIHPRRGRRASGANDFFADGIDGADIVDHPALERHRQLLTLGEHIRDAFVRGVAARQHLAVEQQPVARFPALDIDRRQRVQINADCRAIGFPFNLWPIIQIGRF